jgi:hypothetical protein
MGRATILSTNQRSCTHNGPFFRAKIYIYRRLHPKFTWGVILSSLHCTTSRQIIPVGRSLSRKIPLNISDMLWSSNRKIGQLLNALLLIMIKFSEKNEQKTSRKQCQLEIFPIKRGENIFGNINRRSLWKIRSLSLRGPNRLFLKSLLKFLNGNP